MERAAANAKGQRSRDVLCCLCVPTPQKLSLSTTVGIFSSFNRLSMLVFLDEGDFVVGDSRHDILGLDTEAAEAVLFLKMV